MYQVVIVEDEYMVAKRLKRLVEKVFNQSLAQLNVFSKIREADAFIAKNSIDLLFLDLNLNGEDGFNILRKYGESSFQTVVISGSIERAIEGFDFGILDFISKPFTNQTLNILHV